MEINNLASFLDQVRREGYARIFAYGSLMWRPECGKNKQNLAWLHGWQRRFALYSTHYRGTEKSPGLVLSLVKGGCCQGMVMEVKGADEASRVVSRVWEREMMRHDPYQARLLPVQCDDCEIYALVFTAREDHPQYAGLLSDQEVIQRIANARGSLGNNKDYLVNTARYLGNLGIADDYIERLAKQLH